MKLLTTNFAKYTAILDVLEAAHIRLENPPQSVLEVQSLDLKEVSRHKAEAMYALHKEPIIVDDAALLLDAYPDFPGALTRLLVQSIGIAGFQLLIDGKVRSARLVCVLSVCQQPGSITQFVGELAGTIGTGRPSAADLPINGVFVPDGEMDCLAVLKRETPQFPDHRFKALNNLVAWLSARSSTR